MCVVRVSEARHCRPGRIDSTHPAPSNPASQHLPPSCTVSVYLRSERAPLRLAAAIANLRTAGVWARVGRLNVRADGVAGGAPRLGCCKPCGWRRARRPPAAALPKTGPEIHGEVKLASPTCQALGALAGPSLRSLRVLAAAPGAAAGRGGWRALRRAALGLRSLVLPAGATPLSSVLGGVEAWPELEALEVVCQVGGGGGVADELQPPDPWAARLDLGDTRLPALRRLNIRFLGGAPPSPAVLAGLARAAPALRTLTLSGDGLGEWSTADLAAGLWGPGCVVNIVHS